MVTELLYGVFSVGRCSEIAWPDKKNSRKKTNFSYFLNSIITINVCSKLFKNFSLGHIWSLVIVLGYICFLVIRLGNIWFVRFLSSHTKNIYDFWKSWRNHTIKIESQKTVQFSFDGNLKNFLDVIQGQIWYTKYWLMPNIEFGFKTYWKIMWRLLAIFLHLYNEWVFVGINWLSEYENFSHIDRLDFFSFSTPFCNNYCTAVSFGGS